MTTERERLTMTCAELAVAFGISEHTVRRLFAKGELPVKGLKLGRRVVFPSAQVRALLGAKEERG